MRMWYVCVREIEERERELWACVGLTCGEQRETVVWCRGRGGKRERRGVGRDTTREKKKDTNQGKKEKKREKHHTKAQKLRFGRVRSLFCQRQ